MPTRSVPEWDAGQVSAAGDVLDLPTACRYDGFMKQNTLYLIIGALAVAVIALGVYIFREETKPKGVELRIDETGISVQEN
ncbi:hypothetical protein ACFFTN_21220 [Aminobacter aganoensis]|uniref:Uncharacterized protein n=2 Tax=Aminobacter TaxID=31988 RepID=A0A7X0KNB8_9HYPH|nr:MULTISPECIES: hypothetical protein [Aminobacter]KQU72866.1 hypothetical protein ASC75_04100 [Aminobacter sp. DSM 101952]MBB6356909.1 hypothetical protein [Aminobacter aganoensis]